MFCYCHRCQWLLNEILKQQYFENVRLNLYIVYKEVLVAGHCNFLLLSLRMDDLYICLLEACLYADYTTSIGFIVKTNVYASVEGTIFTNYDIHLQVGLGFEIVLVR